MAVDTPDSDEIGPMLARAGHRYTRGRRRLVEILGELRRPVTLPDVLEADPELSQSSAYRNLDVLERSGVIRRLSTGSEFAYFELAEPLLGHHHHLICVECGAVEDVELADDVEKAVDRALRDAARTASFEPLHHSLDLHGHCAACS